MRRKGCIFHTVRVDQTVIKLCPWLSKPSCLLHLLVLVVQSLCPGRNCRQSAPEHSDTRSNIQHPLNPKTFIIHQSKLLPSVFFPFNFLCCTKSGDQPQEDLAKKGFKI
jgi:hypothetical protein